MFLNGKGSSNRLWSVFVSSSSFYFYFCTSYIMHIMCILCRHVYTLHMCGIYIFVCVRNLCGVYIYIYLCVLGTCVVYIYLFVCVRNLCGVYIYIFVCVRNLCGVHIYIYIYICVC